MRLLVATIVPLLLSPPPVDGYLGVYLDTSRTEAVVVEVIPNSPAAAAGLRVGDVLLAVGDRSTPDRESFVAALETLGPGAQVALRLRRDGAEQTVHVTLGKRPAPSAPPPASAPGPASPRQRPAPQVEVAPLRQTEPGQVPVGGVYLGLGVRESGDRLVIDRVLADSPASKVDLRVGDALTGLGGQAIRSLGDLDRALAKVEIGSKLVLELLRDRRQVVRLEMVATARPEPGRADGRQAAVVPPRVPSPPTPPVPPADPSNGPTRAEFEREIAALRAELAELKRQIESLRPRSGRE